MSWNWRLIFKIAVWVKLVVCWNLQHGVLHEVLNKHFYHHCSYVWLHVRNASRWILCSCCNWEASTVCDAVCHPFISHSSFLFFFNKVKKSETSPKLYEPTCLRHKARRKGLAPLPKESHRCGLEKQRRGLCHFQSIVCSCSPGMPHILKLLPRAKNSSAKFALFQSGLTANKMGTLYAALFRPRVNLPIRPQALSGQGRVVFIAYAPSKVLRMLVLTRNRKQLWFWFWPCWASVPGFYRYWARQLHF